MVDLKWIFLLFIFMGCGNKERIDITFFHNLPSDEAGEVVRKAIETAGTWDNWKNKQDFSFYKKITHLDSTGQIEKSVKQLHQYNMGPKFQARMSWKIGDDEFLIVNNGEESRKYLNGEELIDHRSLNEAWNSSFGSHYVISMPFKLTDPGVHLTYEGIDTSVMEKPVHSLRVTYDEGAGSTGGMHRWWYYFEMDNYDLAGNYLDYGEGYSFTTYESFETVDGMRLHNKRYSYISDEHKKRKLLRTIYENEEMKFDQDLPAHLFRLK